MRIVRFEFLGNIKYGTIEGDAVRGFQGSPFKDFKGPGSSFPLDGSAYKLSEVKLLTPCNPSKYVGIGINYRKTAENMKAPIPKIPIIFLKPTTSIIGPNDNIVLPPAPSKVIHEGELALVIGKEAKDVSEEGPGSTFLVIPVPMMFQIFYLQRRWRKSYESKGTGHLWPVWSLD